MKFNWKNILVLFIVIFIAGVLRFYQLDKIPPGLNTDEVSEGYNAYSLLHTGKDRYGHNFPILFRSFGSFQAPLYTYLTIIPVYLFGNSIFSIHLVSAISGVILVITTLILLVGSQQRKWSKLPIITTFLVAASPWAVFFSRIGTEASLGVTLFCLSFLMFYLSLKHLWFFPLAAFILGLSTHAYYSEKLISVLFLIGFILLFKKYLLVNKKLFVLGLMIFGLTQVPYLLIANSGAFTRRLTQIDYFNEQFFQNNSGALHFAPFGRFIFIIREFLSHYLTYFSPRNLFFDPDPQGARSMPDLSVFYNWMIIPLLFGFVKIFKNRSAPFFKMILLVVLIAPIPAALTRDPFYTIRVLVFLWVLTIIISLGIDDILNKLSKSFVKYSLVVFLLIYSGITLYISYFILVKYERSNSDYSYMMLVEKTNKLQYQKFVVDASRQPDAGVIFAFFKKYDPNKLQKDLGLKVSNQYYDTFEFDETYLLENIEVRPIVWGEDTCKKQILVGDLLAISEDQVREHHLQFLFDLQDMAGDITLKGYMTNPDKKCNKEIRT